MYEYTTTESNSEEYLEMIDKIEELKENINFKKMDLTAFCKQEAYESARIENNSFTTTPRTHVTFVM